jgi:hypothetical protein
MKFPFFTCFAIMLTGLFFFLYIMFNYGFHNPVSGAFTLLDAHRDEMLGNFSAWGQDLLNFMHNWWGLGMCACIINVIVCAFIDVLRSPKQSME